MMKPLNLKNLTIILALFLATGCGDEFRDSSKPDNPTTPQAQLVDQITGVATSVIDNTLTQVIADIKAAPLWSEIGWARNQFCTTGQSQYLSYLSFIYKTPLSGAASTTNQLYNQICL